VRCRALFTTHDDFSDLTPTQYETAYAWLRASGLLDALHSPVPAEQRIFSVASASAAWFLDSDMLIRGPDELPSDAIRAASALGLDEVEAYAQIVATWGKVDLARRERIGAAGELALINLLTPAVDAKVEGQCGNAHIEVKSTTRKGRLTIYLSRNEFETMRRDVAWQLVAVRLDAALTPVAIGTVPGAWIASEAPTDRASYGRWEACRLEVPPAVVQPGLPAIRQMLATNAAALLMGTISW
jgi:Domain of unknown function (DUF3883)